MKCLVCDERPIWAWTDTHGIAQCRCGTPYRIFHYDESNKRIEKAPEIVVDPEYIEPLRRYWEETKSTIPSGCSFPGGQERASDEEQERFYAWLKKNGPARSKDSPEGAKP